RAPSPYDDVDVDDALGRLGFVCGVLTCRDDDDEDDDRGRSGGRGRGRSRYDYDDGGVGKDRSDWCRTRGWPYD
ncbi:hypothetical protein AAER56_17670, partial [Acinetobacter baumannii]